MSRREGSDTLLGGSPDAPGPETTPEASDDTEGAAGTRQPDQRDPTNRSPYQSGQSSSTGLGGVSDETAGGGTGPDFGGGTGPREVTDERPART
jgi:hypothetical protein